VIIAATNVVSEFMKDTPDPAVLAWAQDFGSADLTICVVTVQEIEHGLGRLPVGRRRHDLEQRWTQLLETFADAIMIYDLPAARHTAAIVLAAQAAGRPMGLADAQIAGICVAGNHTLATRNISDFANTNGLALTNPFEQ
jgi:predicted nucleic acid-binding protein